MLLRAETDAHSFSDRLENLGDLAAQLASRLANAVHGPKVLLHAETQLTCLTSAPFVLALLLVQEGSSPVL